MEDLDAERLKLGMTQAALRDLEWLGLDWDGEMVLQSIGAERFDRCVEDLIGKGVAYPCVCTRAEIAASQSAPHPAEAGAEREARYPGTCRGRFASVEAAERATGRSPCVRLVARPGRIRIEDGFAGRFECDVQAEAGDFPIARKAGAAAYQLAVAVDDARAGVTEVLRGEDLLPSAARQFLVQESLGLRHPRWFHVPLVVDTAGKRLAKRTDGLAIAQLRERGIDARAVVSWIARRSGIAGAAGATARELASSFDLSRVPRAPVVCGPAELAELGFRST